MTKAKIRGILSNMMKGLRHVNITAKSLVGMSINDRDGKRIGTITEICEEKNFWTGEIVVASLETLGDVWLKGLSIKAKQEATHEK